MSLVPGVLRAVPAVPLAAFRITRDVLGIAESAALGLLGDRLRAVEARNRPAMLTTAPVAEDGSPAEMLNRLLSRALDSDTAMGQQDHAVAVLSRLVPDEARILAALARGETAPFVSVYDRRSGRPALMYASSIGRSAAITVPSSTPAYVSHLIALGLVDLGAERSEHGLAFELILAERGVRHALKDASWGKIPARVQRGSISISRFGGDIWRIAGAPATGITDA